MSVLGWIKEVMACWSRSGRFQLYSVLKAAESESIHDSCAPWLLVFPNVLAIDIEHCLSFVSIEHIL